MSVTLRRVVLGAVALLVVFGVARAATFKFHEKEKAIREACQADLKKQGITRDAARVRMR